MGGVSADSPILFQLEFNQMQKKVKLLRHMNDQETVSQILLFMLFPCVGQPLILKMMTEQE